MSEVLMIDDEPASALFIQDFLGSRGISLRLCTNYSDGLKELSGERKYRFVICDLNIPIGFNVDAPMERYNVSFERFPGVYLASKARTLGYRDRQVFVYSVHREANVNQFLDDIGCSYLIKGRPRQIFEEIDCILGYDPTKE